MAEPETGQGYGVEDRLPPATLVINAIQHVAIIAPIGLVFPALVAHAAAASAELAQAVVAASLLALGVGSILLCMRGRLLGSGFLVPSVFTAAYLPASLAAAEAGGLPLVVGMTIFAGFCEILFSFLLYRFRSLIPAEIAGLAVLMIGLTLALLGFRLVFGLEASGRVDDLPERVPDIVIGLGTFAFIAVLNIWGAGRLRTFSVLIGVAIAYAAAAAIGLVGAAAPGAGGGFGLFRMPQLPLALPAFEAWLAPQFAIGALAAALRAMGDITTCQRMNDRKWVRPDFASIERGVRADGLSTMVSGCLGSVGLNSFSGSIGLAQASGVKSRHVGLAIGIVFVLLACFPPVIALAASIPHPVTGAVLLFSSTFIIASGLQVIVSRLLDSRRILTIGLAITFGISHDAFLGFYAALPSWIGTISSSPMVVSLVLALALNALFRIGTARTVTLTVPVDDQLTGRIQEFCEQSGARWGARREVVERLFGAAIETAELAFAQAPPGDPFELTLTFDEFFLDATVRYRLETPQRPPPAEEEAGLPVNLADLPHLLIRRLADRVTETVDHGFAVMKLRFDA